MNPPLTNMKTGLLPEVCDSLNSTGLCPKNLCSWVCQPVTSFFFFKPIFLNTSFICFKRIHSLLFMNYQFCLLLTYSGQDLSQLLLAEKLHIYNNREVQNFSDVPFNGNHLHVNEGNQGPVLTKDDLLVGELIDVKSIWSIVE